MDTPSTYNLHDELKKHLYLNKKERIHACGNKPEFQFMFSCFHNYEVSNAVVIVCLSVCQFGCMCMCVYLHACLCLYACVSVSVCLCVSVLVCLYVCACVRCVCVCRHGIIIILFIIRLKQRGICQKKL